MPGDLHRAGRPLRGRVVVAGRDARHVGGVLRLLRVERQLRVAPVGARGRERARDDHLRRRVGGVALRISGGHREARRREERMRLVDAVVDHADLDPVARGRQRRAPDLRRADHLRALVERAVVADAPLHLAHAGDRRDPGHRARGRHDGEAVQHELVAPADPRAGNGGADAGGDARLLALDRGPGMRTLGERLAVEQRDELDRSASGDRRPRRRRPHERQRERGHREGQKTPVHAKTAATLSVRADVAELVDAHGSGPCGGDPVEVQVLSSA